MSIKYHLRWAVAPDGRDVFMGEVTVDGETQGIPLDSPLVFKPVATSLPELLLDSVGEQPHTARGILEAYRSAGGETMDDTTILFRAMMRPDDVVNMRAAFDLVRRRTLYRYFTAMHGDGHEVEGWTSLMDPHDEKVAFENMPPAPAA